MSNVVKLVPTKKHEKEEEKESPSLTWEFKEERIWKSLYCPDVSLESLETEADTSCEKNWQCQQNDSTNLN